MSLLLCVKREILETITRSIILAALCATTIVAVIYARSIIHTAPLSTGPAMFAALFGAMFLTYRNTYELFLEFAPSGVRAKAKKK